MQRSVRQKTIIQAVQSAGEVTVEGLVRLTGASPITVRRDLAELQDLGQLVRTHGGARRGGRRGLVMPFQVRAAEDPAGKEALARAAAELVADGESVIVDNGTTCTAIARGLAGRRLQVLALSLHAAGALAAVPGAETLVPGGPVQPDSLAMIGAQAVDAVRDFRADVVFLGACAAAPAHGLTSTEAEDARLKKACIASAARVILVASAEKLQRTSTHRFGRIEDLAHVVTTEDAEPHVLDRLQEAGADVVLVPRA